MLGGIFKFGEKSDKKTKEIKKFVKELCDCGKAAPPSPTIERVRQTWYEGQNGSGLLYEKKIKDKTLEKYISKCNLSNFNDGKNMFTVRAYLEKLQALYLLDNKDKTAADFIEIIKNIGIDVNKFPSLVKYSYSAENINRVIKNILEKIYLKYEIFCEDVLEIEESLYSYWIKINSGEKKIDINNLKELVNNNYNSLKKLDENILFNINKSREILEQARKIEEDSRKSLCTKSRSDTVKEITKILNDKYNEEMGEYVKKYDNLYKLCLKYSDKSYKDVLGEVLKEYNGSDDVPYLLRALARLDNAVADLDEYKNHKEAIEKLIKFFNTILN